MKRWELSILIGLIVAIFTSSITGFAQQCGEVRGATVRLHILANSNSQRDQSLKLAVRDAVLGEVQATLAKAPTRQEALRLARESLPLIEQIAGEALRAGDCGDEVRAEVVNMYFATRRYENGVVMPAGRYDAVRILIGEGVGNNWWCVMFPPMCLPAASEKSTPQGEVPTTAGEDLFIHAAPEYEVRLAVVEAYESAKEYFTQRRGVK